jgi:hypothetical protein
VHSRSHPVVNASLKFVTTMLRSEGHANGYTKQLPRVTSPMDGVCCWLSAFHRAHLAVCPYDKNCWDHQDVLCLSVEFSISKTVITSFLPEMMAMVTLSVVF